LITYGSVLLMNLFIKYFGTSRKLKPEKVKKAKTKRINIQVIKEG
jgi:hypothetical protein